MQIGILGSGVTAQTLGSKLVQIGHEVMLGSREEANPSSVTWARDAGQQHALYGTFRNAASFGEIIFNCTLGMSSLEALQMAGAENLKDKILIDTANPIDRSAGIWKLTVCNTDSLGEQIQRAFPETKVVKTLNTINANVIADPAKLPEMTDIFVSGNDLDAKATVIRLLREWFGWRHVIDLGDITTSRGVEMYVLFWHYLRDRIPAHRFNIKVVSS